jgi:hypothetical protein
MSFDPPTPPLPPSLPQWGPPVAPEQDYVVVSGSEKRGRRWIAGLTAGAVLAAGVGVTAVVVQSGGNGGAATPEEAVTAMLDAAADEDLLGMVDALAPFERDLLLDFVTRASELSDEDAADVEEQSDLSAWVDLAYSDPTYSVTQLRDDIASVEITSGSGSVTAGEQLADAMEEFIAQVAPDDEPTAWETFGFDRSQFTETQEFELDELPAMVTVQRNGGWYVSVQHTIAEAARLESGDAFPERITPTGASSPEAAVREMVDAAIASDARRVIELMDPNELPALHDYGALVLDDETEAYGTDEITEFEVSVDGSTVRFDRLEITTTYEGGDVEYLSLDGGCIRSGWEYDGEVEWTPEFGCADAPDDEYVPEIFGTMGETFPGLSITTVERDGQWFVQPVGTYVDLVFDWITALDEELGPDWFADLQQGYVDLFAGLGEMGSEEFESVGGEIGGDEYSWPGDECWELYDAAGQEACWQELLAAGEIESTDLPVELQVPECYPEGLDWEAEGLDPASLQSCLETAIAEGRVDEYAVYDEDLHPECYAWQEPFDAAWQEAFEAEADTSELDELWEELAEQAWACADGEAEPPVFRSGLTARTD